MWQKNEVFLAINLLLRNQCIADIITPKKFYYTQI